MSFPASRAASPLRGWRSGGAPETSGGLRSEPRPPVEAV